MYIHQMPHAVIPLMVYTIEEVLLNAVSYQGAKMGGAWHIMTLGQELNPEFWFQLTLKPPFFLSFSVSTLLGSNGPDCVLH